MFTKVKNESDNEEYEDEEEDEEEDAEDNDFVILDFVGRKGKCKDYFSFLIIYYTSIWYVKKIDNIWAAEKVKRR